MLTKVFCGDGKKIIIIMMIVSSTSTITHNNISDCGLFPTRRSNDCVEDRPTLDPTYNNITVIMKFRKAPQRAVGVLMVVCGLLSVLPPEQRWLPPHVSTCPTGGIPTAEAFVMISSGRKGLKRSSWTPQSLPKTGEGAFANSDATARNNGQVDDPLRRPRGRRPTDDNLSINNDETTTTKATVQGSVTLSPLQVMHPSYSEDFELELSRSSYLRRPVSLYKALDRMRQALERLPPVESLSSSSFSMIRLEQRIHSDTTDPLAWLDAQVSRNDPSRAILAKAPLFYFGNQEGTTEVAVLGSVCTANETAQVWESMPNLPRNTRWYGGEPFDKDSPRRGPWTAWETGTAWWIVPAIEVRREGNDTNLAIHINQDTLEYVKAMLTAVDYKQSETRAPTTLPPILSRDGNLPDATGDVQDGQDLYERAVTAALPQLSDDFQKVVLARPQQLHFGVPLQAGSLLRRWKYGGHEGGHLFWMKPEASDDVDEQQMTPNFVGCTPERLFRVNGQKVVTEALAGTRPRGTTAAADAQLCQDLFDSPKDMAENRLTGDFIVDTLLNMQAQGWVRLPSSAEACRGSTSVFVRRLRHLQHICHSYAADIVEKDLITNVTQYLLGEMHPTPAVCGVPATTARQFIRDYESIGFDRGFYAGPVGYLGREQSDLIVALRSGVIQQRPKSEISGNKGAQSTLTLFAGAGIVAGSTVKGEWAETNYKLAVVASLFPQSPFSLQGASTPNAAWASAFVEELIRNGITQFYVCPGSRSTPLVVAISKAIRAHLGIVHADSVHDERAAAFRALGYARGAGKPAAVITSSGTAVANLYPAVVEASMDGVPMLLLTADRPYESRSTGANQAIDQVGIFSSSYVRWSRDIPPPSDEVPISLVLSDVDHAIDVSKRTRGPVHLNIQFRENLAPDAGKIRNDDRINAVTKFNAFHFTSSPKFQRWSLSGDHFTRILPASSSPGESSVQEIARLIESSTRGLIIVGNVRPSVSSGDDDAILSIIDTISEFAEHTGFPIIAGVQSAAIRFRSTAVIPFAEHLLRSPLVRDNLRPDLIFQIGAPLVSTEIPHMIRKAIANDASVHHVLVHPHTSDERFDPDFSVTHRVSSEILPWLVSLQKNIRSPRASELATLLPLGRRLQSVMKGIIQESVASVTVDRAVSLSEPEIILSLSESIERSKRHALFLSNSMPIRDAEAFLYPATPVDPTSRQIDLSIVGTSRGASGIDGIIATAKGLAEFAQRPTTLLIGDVSAMHDISSLHALANDVASQRKNPGKSLYPLTTVIVNNDGGGIFSFLPIAAYGADVNFNEFFGTPTSSFDFKKGSEAFGVPCQVSSDREKFSRNLEGAWDAGQHSVIEARVTDRETNVRIHREISSRTSDFLENYLKPPRLARSTDSKLYFRVHSQSRDADNAQKRTLLMLHGWMGDSSEWDETAKLLSKKLSKEWNLIALDLPGHGASPGEHSSESQLIRKSLGLWTEESGPSIYSIEGLARAALSSLESEDIESIDAIVGYSLGGRVALAMRDLCSSGELSGAIQNTTKTILLSTVPRAFRFTSEEFSTGDRTRLKKDDRLAEEILRTSHFTMIEDVMHDESHLLWSEFVDSWYSAPLWGGLQGRREYEQLRKRRSQSLHKRAADIAAVLRGCSPPRDCPSTPPKVFDENVLFVSGTEDEKYSDIGEELSASGISPVRSIPASGHALLTEAPHAVAEMIAEFLSAPKISTAIIDVDMKEEGNGNTPGSLSSETEDMARKVKEKNGLSIFEFTPFTVDLVDQSISSNVQSGIGWGENAKASKDLNTRSGVLVEGRFPDGSGIALGEASPLEGVHPESFSNASNILARIQQCTETGSLILSDFDHWSLLKLDGYFSQYSKSLDTNIGGLMQSRSVCSALEMILHGLASQKAGVPILQALARGCEIPVSDLQTIISLNGLMLRNSDEKSTNARYATHANAFSSIKVKVGHQDSSKDLMSVSDAFERTDIQLGRSSANVRLDANRAWNETEAMIFTASLEGIDVRSFDRIEFIEEPLKTRSGSNFSTHVEDLERFYRRAGLRYALDESLADLALECAYDFSLMKPILLETFKSSRGCAAFVLKPTLLGLELSMQLATLARSEFDIGAVFTSCFESGVALAYISFLAALSDSINSKAPVYAHGLGTFEMLSRDTLTPSFASHVDEFGRLNVASLSRSLYGLSLSELKQAISSELPRKSDVSKKSSTDVMPGFDASTSQSGSEISFAVSLDLPFSAEIAHARFTDLPQQPRWSPWLSSVAYQGTQETEWKLNIRGIPIQWRAESKVLLEPWPAIEWKSISGIENSGVAEFFPTDVDACEMRVRLVTRPPRILRPLFRGASIFLEDFIRDKLLKWSLEMFRDVVKADLALERGDVELGDALFGAVAGKAVAIEAALNSSNPAPRNRSKDTNDAIDE
eukprot:scaffold1872_cov262-Amphora_coffeaeformis.AAC.18